MGGKPETSRAITEGGGEALLAAEQRRDARGVEHHRRLAGEDARGGRQQQRAGRERERRVEQRLVGRARKGWGRDPHAQVATDGTTLCDAVTPPDAPLRRLFRDGHDLRTRS